MRLPALAQRMWFRWKGHTPLYCWLCLCMTLPRQMPPLSFALAAFLHIHGAAHTGTLSAADSKVDTAYGPLYPVAQTNRQPFGVLS